MFRITCVALKEFIAYYDDGDDDDVGVYVYCVCLMHLCSCYSEHVKVRGLPLEVGSFLSPQGSQGPNL